MRTERTRADGEARDVIHAEAQLGQLQLLRGCRRAELGQQSTRINGAKRDNRSSRLQKVTPLHQSLHRADCNRHQARLGCDKRRVSGTSCSTRTASVVRATQVSACLADRLLCQNLEARRRGRRSAQIRHLSSQSAIGSKANDIDRGRPAARSVGGPTPSACPLAYTRTRMRERVVRIEVNRQQTSPNAVEPRWF